MRTRRAGLTLVAGLVLAVLPAVAPAAADDPPPGCTGRQLPGVPAGAYYSAVTAGDPTGRYLAGRSLTEVDGGYVVQGLLWIDESPRLLPSAPLRPFTDLELTDVNQQGIVVGNRTTDNGSFHTDAFAYRNGRYRFLPGLVRGEQTRAMAINARGDIVGSSGGETSPTTAVVWPASRPGTVRVLRADRPAPFTLALDLNDAGTVLGYLGPRPPETPYVWPATGRPHPLTGTADIVPFEAGVIGDRWLVATVALGPEQQTGLGWWDLRTGRVTATATGYTPPEAVNSQGTVAVRTGLLRRDGTLTSLPGLGQANAIADNGVAAGLDTFEQHAAVWTGC